MKIVVVGGAGNISSAVVSLLVEQGHEVAVFSRGNRPIHPDAQPLVGDRQDYEHFEATMRSNQFDVAIDMVSFTREDGESGLRAYADVGQLIHTSTIMVYGSGRDFLFTTEELPMAAVEPYGRQKAEIDELYFDAHDRTGFPVTILRPSNAYGGPEFPILRQIGVSAEWIDRIRRGKPIVVCGDGLALTRFLHVRDAAVAYAGAVGRKAMIGEVYNVVNPQIVTWADYHRTAMSVLGREVDLVGVPFAALETLDIPGFELCDQAFRLHYAHSGAKLQAHIPEFEPQVSLEQGLSEVLEVSDREGAIPSADETDWEDRVIAAQRRVPELTEEMA